MDLSRVAMVIGKDKLPVLGQARIAVVGLGGVGSYVAESLCRSGVGHLLLIDADKVAASNINRQLPALTSTFGRFKTEVVRQRLLDINPDCEIETVSKFYEPGAFAEFFSGSFTFIADAIDQNEYLNKDKRYEGLLPQNCKLLLGARYAILREEFYKAREKMRLRDGKIKNILVFFGGSDPSNETLKALKAIVLLQRQDIRVNVIVGQSNPNKEAIENFCKKNNMYYFCQIDNMAEFMNQADLAIGAGGTVTWERCFLGLPALVIAIAENQVELTVNCASKGILVFLGDKSKVTTTLLSKEILELEGAKLLRIAQNCLIEGACYGRKDIFTES